jgi:hypothetical protein
MKPHEKNQIERQEQKEGTRCCVRVGESLMTWDLWGRNKWMKLGKKQKSISPVPVS